MIPTFDTDDEAFPHRLENEGGQAHPPLLLLGARVFGDAPEGGWDPRLWTPRPGRDWFRLRHQAAGIACHHVQLVGTPLRWRPEMRDAFWKLARQYDGDDLGVFGVTLEQVVSYDQHLREIHPALTCNHSYGALVEAVYPIDCATEALAALSDEELPADLDELLVWDPSSPWAKLVGSVGRWTLWVLSENSD